MLTMNQSLFELFRKGELSYDDALGKSPVPEELLNMMKQASAVGGGKR
jgi:Tfp pilus assembly ATPase PilU